MAKMSKFFKTVALTQKLRELQIGEVLLLELQPEVPFNEAMKIVTSLSDRLAKSVTQSAMKSVETKSFDARTFNVIRIECIG